MMSGAATMAPSHVPPPEPAAAASTAHARGAATAPPPAASPYGYQAFNMLIQQAALVAAQHQQQQTAMLAMPPMQAMPAPALMQAQPGRPAPAPVAAPLFPAGPLYLGGAPTSASSTGGIMPGAVPAPSVVGGAAPMPALPSMSLVQQLQQQAMLAGLAYQFFPPPAPAPAPVKVEPAAATLNTLAAAALAASASFPHQPFLGATHGALAAAVPQPAGQASMGSTNRKQCQAAACGGHDPGGDGDSSDASGVRPGMHGHGRGLAGKLEPSICKRCRFGFLTRQDLEAHKCTSTRARAPQPSRILVCCDECSRRFLQGNDRLVWHKLVNPEDLVSPACDVCGGQLECDSQPIPAGATAPRAPKASSRSGSASGPSERRPFECKICSAQFLRGDRLLAHSRVHTGEKPFSCEFCNRAFSRKDRLKSHMKTHSQEMSYKCTVCHRHFNVAMHLSKHLMTHAVEATLGGGSRCCSPP